MEMTKTLDENDNKASYADTMGPSSQSTTGEENMENTSLAWDIDFSGPASDQTESDPVSDSTKVNNKRQLVKKDSGVVNEKEAHKAARKTGVKTSRKSSQAAGMDSEARYKQEQDIRSGAPEKSRSEISRLDDTDDRGVDKPHECALRRELHLGVSQETEPASKTGTQTAQSPSPDERRGRLGTDRHPAPRTGAERHPVPEPSNGYPRISDDSYPGNNHERYSTGGDCSKEMKAQDNEQLNSRDVLSSCPRIKLDQTNGHTERDGSGETPGHGRRGIGEAGRKMTFSGRSNVTTRSNSLTSAGQVASDVSSVEEYETVNVAVRVRPLNSQESGRKEKCIIQFPGDGAVWVDSGVSTKSFTFNVMFEPEAIQEDVFEHCGIKKLIDMALNGYSCTAFAFGQTGSGKTYTITGPPELFQDNKFNWPESDLHGLIPRSFQYLFYLMRTQPNNNYRITASYLEIYNEQVIDLLNPNQRHPLAVRWSKNKGFYVENLFIIECESINDLMSVLEEGLRNRATGSNSVNEHSSRSHSMLTLNIESDMVDPDDDNLYVTKHGKLTFVDLAGSEKTKTGSEMAADPGHLAETNNINRSLLVLGNCISALGDPKKRQGHIPYRDSKLTKLLADSLGGQGVTLMIACVAPSAVNSAESMNTLRYANRAKKIKSKPVVKMDPREKLIISLKREIKVLRQENHYLRQQLDFPVKPRGQLQKENDAKFLQLLKEQKRDGKVSDHGLYEMLQEYMIENETLRHENSDLLQSKDGGRREQQLLARENERLLKKMDHYEKERVMQQSPVSVYSTGSTLSRKSTGLYSQYEGQPYTNGHQDNRKDAPWGPQRQPHQIAESPRGKKTSPPSHLQHPMKPPHRLNEPVNNPAYIDNNSYSSQYQQHKHSPDAAPRGPPRGRERNIPQHSENDDYAAYHQQHSQPRGSDHSPSRIPRPRKEDPSPQRSRTNDYSPNRQPSNRSKDKPGAVPNVAFGRPAGKNTGKSPPVQRKFNKGGPSQQPALLTINSDEENLQVTETDKALQDRLRQDLVDLQGQIRNQAQQLERTQGDQGNTKQGRR